MLTMPMRMLLLAIAGWLNVTSPCRGLQWWKARQWRTQASDGKLLVFTQTPTVNGRPHAEMLSFRLLG